MKNILTAAILCIATTAYAQPFSLEECKDIREEINHYEELRRKGGSVTKMESWKKSLRILETQFQEGECIKYGRAVW